MNTRLRKIDEIRGLTLISMILYHFMWDLYFIAGFHIDWYTGPIGYVWQKSICICFIFISGFCFSMGKNRLKRSLLIFICGCIITAVTLIFMPENRVIFGILTFIGSAGLIMILVDKPHKYLEGKLDRKTLNLTMLIGNFIFFIAFFKVNFGQIFVFVGSIDVPHYFYSGYISTFFGFPAPTFFSTDYFAILPWIFLYFVGYYAEKIILKINKVEDYLKEDRLKAISFIGRKTLIIYMLHQPVLYLITLIAMRLK